MVGRVGLAPTLFLMWRVYSPCLSLLRGTCRWLSRCGSNAWSPLYQSGYLNQLIYGTIETGRGGGSRSHDPCLKRALLYQLSYTPTSHQISINKRTKLFLLIHADFADKCPGSIRTASRYGILPALTTLGKLLNGMRGGTRTHTPFGTTTSRWRDCQFLHSHISLKGRIYLQSGTRTHKWHSLPFRPTIRKFMLLCAM